MILSTKNERVRRETERRRTNLQEFSHARSAEKE
jgi:hypothetical protein